jgi:hypothetical protein
VSNPRTSLPGCILVGMAEDEQRQALEQELTASRELVRELEAELAALRPVAAELRQELRALRLGLGSTAEIDVDDDWPSGNGSERSTALWSGTAPPPPLPKPVVVPRLILEAAFLALAATLAALADLSALAIVGVMAGAWLLVALSEWVAFEKQRRWRLDEVAPLVAESGSPAWYMPPVEQTMLEPPDRSAAHTIVSLPAGEDTGVVPPLASEDTGQIPAPRGRFWRKARHEESADDGLEDA